jgi:molybdopterin synthase catalytic subunit
MNKKYLIAGPVTSEIITGVFAKMIENKNNGAHSVFIGQVRADDINGKTVKAIDYSAYEEMVTVEAEKIQKAVTSEFEDVSELEIIHSTGIVKAGEISLFVLVSSGHRHQAIEACSKTVELIKENLPVWKKEILDDNTHIWK